MEDNGRGDIGNGRYIYKTWSTRRLFYTSGTHSISDKSVESAPEWRVRDAVPSWRAVEAEDFRSVRLESIMHHSTGKSCVNELSWTSESSRFFLSLSLSSFLSPSPFAILLLLMFSRSVSALLPAVSLRLAEHILKVLLDSRPVVIHRRTEFFSKTFARGSLIKLMKETVSFRKR